METDGQTIPVPPATEQVKYAGFWVRWAANFIDGLVLIVPSIIISFLVTISLINTQTPGTVLFVFGYALNYILSLGVSWGYFVYMTNKYHATLGKRVFGLEVISDKPEGLSLGQVILRETIGKLISGIILLIGYIMVAFTARKQALHDKMASTLVIYKDPSKKVPVWAIIVIAILPAIVILGILSSVVLASLNTSREKAQDSLVKSTAVGIISESFVYSDKNGSLVGFIPSKQMPECSGVPTINIAPDGQNLAVFAKMCSDSTKYFCTDSLANKREVVDEVLAKSGKTSCQ